MHGMRPRHLPRRGQRLRDLGPGRGPDAGRRRCATGRVVPGPEGAPRRRHGRHGELPRDDGGRGAHARAIRTRAGPGPRHAAVLALDVGRRAPLQERRRAHHGGGAGSPATVRALPDGRRTGDGGRARGARGGRRPRDSGSDRPRHRGAEAGRVERHALRLLARGRSRLGGVRGCAGPRGPAGHDGGGDQPRAEGRDGARPARHRVRRGRGGREPRRAAGGGHRQGRRVQGNAGPAARLRARALLQLPPRRSQHRRARDRDGGAGPEAGGRDPVLRLHLAGDDADPRRADDAAGTGRTTRSRARW